MLSSELYRQFMADCLRWAKAARSENDRESYLQLARTWHEAALHIERGLGLEHFPSVLNRRDSQPLSPGRIWGN